MKLLLDTHILLWVMQDSKELSREARALIQKAEEIHVSSVCLWEATIKSAIGKLKIDMNDLDERLAKQGFLPLPITWAHTRQVRQLPLLHGDPFDRMLIAQAMSEPLHLMTHDAQLKPYSELVLLV